MTATSTSLSYQGLIAGQGFMRSISSSMAGSQKLLH